MSSLGSRYRRGQHWYGCSHNGTRILRDGAAGDFHLRGNRHTVDALDSRHAPAAELGRAERREHRELERTYTVGPVDQGTSLTLALMRARASVPKSSEKRWPKYISSETRTRDKSQSVPTPRVRGPEPGTSSPFELK